MLSYKGQSIVTYSDYIWSKRKESDSFEESLNRIDSNGIGYQKKKHVDYEKDKRNIEIFSISKSFIQIQFKEIINNITLIDDETYQITELRSRQ